MIQNCTLSGYIGHVDDLQPNKVASVEVDDWPGK